MENSTTTPIDKINENPPPLTPGQYALYIFLGGLPLVGIILLLVWAFGGDGNIHRTNWAKGMLLITLISIALVALIFIFFGSVFALSSLYS